MKINHEEDSVELNHSMKLIRKENERNKREIRRLRSSVSFQLGLHLTQAVRKPWRLFVLPISFPWVALNLGLKKIGKKSNSFHGELSREKEQTRKNCIVFFPTNGVGFGHFTRLLAIAKALRKRDSEIEILFFTQMPTLHVLYSEDFPTYHISGRYKFSKMEPREWNAIIEEMLRLIFETHKPKCFVFDGTYPYRGMLDAIESEVGMQKWWVRRGSVKKSKSIPSGSLDYFDGLLIPAEIDTKQSPVENEHIVSPISILNPEDAWDRNIARMKLSIPRDSKVVYVQLGAGQINDINSILRRVLDNLFLFEDIVVVLGESMLGNRLDFQHEKLRLLRDYPNSLYFNAFDYSIQAGGYNSFYEMRRFGIPTLFIPNSKTGFDDQLSRCMQSVEEGWGLVSNENDSNLGEILERLLEMNRVSIPMENGADEAIEIMNLLNHNN